MIDVLQPDGCDAQTTCDSDEICCCAAKMRDRPCVDAEEKQEPDESGETLCNRPDTGEPDMSGFLDINGASDPIALAVNRRKLDLKPLHGWR